jgi:hypothetical protein
MNMRTTGLLLAIFLASPAAAQDSGQQDVEIVVRGASLTETRKQLDDCLARHCPPAEDIEATLAHAENQFLAGAYGGAQRTLAKGHSRNARYARTLPTEVADLDRAYGRLTNLIGFPDKGRFLQIQSLEALKTGLGDSDARVLMQRLAVADEFARAGRERAADDVYRSVAKRAHKAGNLQVQGHAMLREAMMYGAIALSWPQYRAFADGRIRQIESTREPELAPFRTAASLLRAKLALFDGDHAALEKAIAAIPPQSGKPLLVYSPPVVLDSHIETTIRTTPDPEWIDIRFRIAADGTVRDVETARDSGNVHGSWPQPVEKAIAARRYAPLALPPGSEGVLRLERFSLVHDVASITESRIRARKTQGRITSLDLTDDSSS